MSPRVLTVRDPVHGDIFVGPVQAAVIDTAVFQRLRYIRQNGLLHLVFPGAVHTRFAHSIGTMHLAQRVLSSLCPDYQPRKPLDHTGSLYYVGTVFQLAALLHDVGHCAFSHSIEHVKINGAPLLLPMEQIVAQWKNASLTKWWEEKTSSGEYKPPAQTEHEQIGILMVGMIFSDEYPQVGDACRKALGVEPATIADDVRALIVSDQELTPSSRFIEACDEVGRGINGAEGLAAERRRNDILDALHTLVSGTLDVDRLDYLLRDSLFTGTTYGVADADVLINGLTFAVSRVGDVERIVLALRSRAVSAMDYLLWSRYQLFLQVLNHKTNVILNAMLADALPEAIDSASVDLGRPKTWHEFLEFTDDQVMSAVRKVCLRNPSGAAYDRALVRRELPLYLGFIALEGTQSEQERAVEEHKRTLAATHLGSADQATRIRTWRATSDLLKGGGLPHVLRRDKASGEDRVLPPGEPGAYQITQWTSAGRVPARFQHMHFFVDRASASA